MAVSNLRHEIKNIGYSDDCEASDVMIETSETATNHCDPRKA